MEDRRGEWANSVEARIVNLNSAQLTADTEIARLRAKAVRDDHILRGDPERNLIGLIEQCNHLTSEINKFNRIFDKDYLGHGGLVNFITYLYDQEKRRDQNTGYRWSFLNSAAVAISSIIVALITMVGSLILSWDKVEAFWERHNKLSPLEQKIEQAKRPKSPHKIFVKRVVPRKKGEPNEPEEEVPQRRGGDDSDVQ